MRKDRFHFELFRWVGIIAPIVAVAGTALYDAYVHAYQHHTGFAGSGATKVLEVCGCNGAWHTLGGVLALCLCLASAALMVRFIGLVGTVYNNLEHRAEQSEYFDKKTK